MYINLMVLVSFKRKYKIVFLLFFLGARQPAVSQINTFANDSLQDVVITATATPKRLKDVPVYTKVISQKDIENTGIVSVNDILSNEMPGIQFGSEAGVPNINMQGLGGNYVLILIDGQRIAGETRNNIDYAMINVGNIERIEIVKGAYATLYGSNAIGGVINIITKNSKKAWEASVEATARSKGFKQWSASVGGRYKKISWLTSARQYTQSGYQLQNSTYEARYYPDNIVVSDSVLNTWQVEGGKLFSIEQKISWSPVEKIKLDLKGSFLQRQRINAGAEGEVLNNFFYNTGGLFTGKYFFNKQNTLSVYYNYNRYRKTNYYRKLREEEDIYGSTLHNVKIISDNILNKKNQLVSGVELLDESLLTYMFQKGKKYRVKTMSIFTQNDYKPGKQLEILTGIRLDNHTDYGVHLSPNIAVKTDFSPRWQGRVSYAGGFRSPSLKELYTDWDHLGMFQIVGAENLKPEVSNNVMLTLTYRQENVELSTNAFHNNIKNKIALFPNVSGDTLFYQNDNKQKIFGAEVSVEYKILKDWKIFAAYAYTNDGLRSSGRNISTTRPGGATFKTEYLWRRDNFSGVLSLSGKYQQRMNVYGLDKVKEQYYKQIYPQVFMWRLNTLLQFKNRLELNVAIENIFNYIPAVYNFYMPMTPGRLYQLTLRYKLDYLLNRK